MSRLAVLVALFLTGALGMSARAEVTPRTRPVVVDADAELRFLNRINRERVERGLPALVRDTRLERLARFHSADMAMNGFVGLTSGEAGSLLDRAATQGRVNRVDVTAQVASGSDLAGVGDPLLDPSVTRVGVGIVEQRGRLWLTQLAVADERPPAYAAANVSVPDLALRLRLAFENLGVPLRFAFVWR